MSPPTHTLAIAELMERSGVKFGTSGARGLVGAMTDQVCYAYTRAFLQHLRAAGELARAGSAVAVAGDLRPSTGRIMEAVARAVADAGHQPVSCGRIPSPALAAWGLREGIPSIMVTGSHIPDDRNGIKYNKADGEILKHDEAGIRAQSLSYPADLFDEGGAFADPARRALPAEDPAAARAYVQRYLDFFGEGALAGLRVGVYEHSTVAREFMGQVIEALGAQVARLGRSETFVPVDTEAIRREDEALARDWAGAGDYDALVSADGDGDRPLISDSAGRWLRGDVAGILCADYLSADTVITPVSSNTAVEACGRFRAVHRTRIGSPYVISAMQQALAPAQGPVVGYEANGGFLTAADVIRDGRTLPALPTRDALIVMLSILALCRERGTDVAALVAGLPARYTASNRLKDFPTELSRARLAELSSGDTAADRERLEALFAPHFGKVAGVDSTDGLRVTFASGEIAHLRPSGNAPELRCYNEAASPERAREMNRICLSLLEGWR